MGTGCYCFTPTMNEATSNEKELALKEREIIAREREVELKAEELKRSRWLNPVVLGLFAASAGLIGNIFVARVNNDNTQAVERLRLQSNLILESIKTDPTSACTNLTFLVNIGFIDDGHNTIRQACNSSSSGARPSILVPSTSSDFGGRVIDEEKRPIAGARVSAVGLPTAGHHRHLWPVLFAFAPRHVPSPPTRRTEGVPINRLVCGNWGRHADCHGKAAVILLPTRCTKDPL